MYKNTLRFNFNKLVKLTVRREQVHVAVSLPSGLYMINVSCMHDIMYSVLQTNNVLYIA